MSRTIEGCGTCEDVWRSWQELALLPLLSLDGCAQVLVVAPHPDDEVLGSGGLLAELQAHGAEIAVLALTDGEASHPHAPIEPAVLARRRAAESELALRALLGGCRIDRLGLPDGGLSLREDDIRTAVAERLVRGAWCLAPLRGDGHPDHEAAGRAAARACRERGAVFVEYPIWMWHWSEPGDPRVPWERARQFPVSLAARRRKSRAISVFTSQIDPISDDPGGAAILPPAIVDRFLRPAEVVFT